MIIREARLEDVEILQKFERKLHRYYESIHVPINVKQWNAQRISQRIEYYIVAEDNGKVVGCAHYNDSSDSVTISHVWVELRYRRCGVGTKLIDTLMEIGKQKGYTTAKLVVHNVNVIASEFYNKKGFVPAGVLLYKNI